MAVTEVVPLQVEQLHPDLLTKPTCTEFLAKNLISRAAKRQGVLALVLSAPYLPSQLQYMDELAGKQSIDMQVYFNSSTGLHAVFTTVEAQEQDSSTSLQSALETALGALQPLSDVQLCLAEGVEQNLQQQLRLWDRAIWAGVLQQKLELNNRVGTWLVVRSLMGAPALQAAQQLVKKKGLHWVEVQEEQVQALVGSAVSSSSSSRRRRKGSTSVVPKSDPTESSRVEAGQQGATDSGGSLIVIGVAELSAKDAVQVAAYELYGRSVDGCGAEVEKAEPADKPLPVGLPRIIWPLGHEPSAAVPGLSVCVVSGRLWCANC